MMAIAALEISEARKRLNALDKWLASERIIYVTRHGKQAFAVVDLDYLSALLETLEIMSDPKSLRAFLDSLDDIAQGRVHGHDEVVAELG